MGAFSKVELLQDSWYSLNPPGGELFILWDQDLERKRLPLVKSSDVDIRVPYTFLNPLQSAFFYTYQGGSALVASPTSSGKSLIAHLFMKNRQGLKVYTAPIKALVYEKAIEFRKYYQVDIRTGDQVLEIYKDLKGDLLVCTYEYLVISLRNNASWVSDVSCIVIDEIHQIFKRPILEELVIYALDNHIDILALSATIPNKEEMAQWLNVNLLLESGWRPVPLKRENKLLKDFLPFTKEPVEVTCEKQKLLINKLLNAIYTLKQKDEKVIVFLPSKKLGWCLLELANSERIGVMNETLPFEKEEREEAEIAFHNADVPVEERRQIEKAFREGDLGILLATQTLAYGVNLPADRVIILVRRSKLGNKFKVMPDGLDIVQMEGRAGRLGIKDIGYSVRLLYGLDEKQLNDELSKSMNGWEKEEDENIDEYFSLFLLIAIHYKGSNFMDFINKTLTYGKENKRKVHEHLKFLERFGYVNDFELTKKGRFCITANISPVALEEYLRRKRLGLPIIATVRPLLGAKLDAIRPFVENKGSYKEEISLIHELLFSYDFDWEDNTDQLLFYTEGFLFNYSNIKNPPGEFSQLGLDAIYLLRRLLSMKKVGFFEGSLLDTLAIAHSIKYGISLDYASLGGIKGIGHIRSNLIKRILKENHMTAPSLGSKVEELFQIFAEDNWRKYSIDILMEQRKLKKELAIKETNKVLSILKSNLSGYLMDDKILVASYMFIVNKQPVKLKKEFLIQKILYYDRIDKVEKL